MKHEVKIIRTSDGWCFQIISFEGEGWDLKIVINVVMHHETLIEALHTAEMLKLHVENLEELPLTQYRCAG